MAGRLLFILLVLAFGYLQWKLWFDRGSVPRAAQLERELKVLQAKNEEARRRNRELEADVRDLEKAGEAVEERARTELGMVKKSETLLQLRDSRAPSPAAKP
ncbi:MAG: septum formation initiator family protein [Casimicrobiaceae bacterium]|nr:septum formation initiator family protein [Casimicrobiaceae bacterium]MCX8098256.1 septum formation initiator family protein [Casimicrobiaceae bacterium]MDW8311260.1 septum formation initiator family protein [Burkholderiales bacterium]